MKLRNNHKGFSMVEMIVVVAIMAIIAGGSLTLLRHVGLANTEKVVQTISKSLSRQQAQTMSKQEKKYLYIYAIDGTYYSLVSESNLSTYSGAVMTKSAGTEIGSGISIYSIAATGTKTLVSGNTIIKVSFKRDGSYDTSNTSCSGISVVNSSGSLTTNIKFVTVSGKSVISTE